MFSFGAVLWASRHNGRYREAWQAPLGCSGLIKSLNYLPIDGERNEHEAAWADSIKDIHFCLSIKSY